MNRARCCNSTAREARVLARRAEPDSGDAVPSRPPGGPRRHQPCERIELRPPRKRHARDWGDDERRGHRASLVDQGAGWSLLADASRVVADPVVRQMGTVVGSLCHNDPSGDWPPSRLRLALASSCRPARAAAPSNIDGFLLDSFTTAIGEGEMAVAVHFPGARERTAGAYQKVERKVGDFATAAAAVQLSLRADGKHRAGGRSRCQLPARAPSASRRPNNCSRARRPRAI